MILKRKISFLLASILTMSTLLQSSLWNNAFAEDVIYYSQDFGSVEDTVPEGWDINNPSYLKFSDSENAPSSAMESVSGVALNAVGSGYGDREAYVDIDPDILMPENTQYITVDFDFYMTGGVNTCNLLTIGNNQNNSYTDLSNTFFALGNGDGVGARNTLRYYDYNADSWVSIDNVNEMWLNARIYIDFYNYKMSFELKNKDGSYIGTYGPFSFASKFTANECNLSRINLSAFRTNGGAVTLNTWIDNFSISSIDTRGSDILSYQGILPMGTLDTDYSLEKLGEETVLKVDSKVSVVDPSVDYELIRVLEFDVMLDQLPTTDYQSIISFDNGSNGNIMVDENGKLVTQKGATKYENILGTGKYINENNWYNVKEYIFLTTSTEVAYTTFAITGDFGNGVETIKYACESRNSDKFRKLNLSLGDSDKGTIYIKKLSLVSKTRPNMTIVYDDTNGKININEAEVTSNTVYQQTVPKLITFCPSAGYDVESVKVNNSDITSDISIELFTGNYNYTFPLQDEDVIINVEFAELGSDFASVTQEDEPYALDPSQPWDVRKYASEARTIQIKNVKMAYRLYKPVGYDPNTTNKYPLVVSLRANGEGNTGFDNEPYTAKHVEDYLTSGQNAIDFPCFILSPQCYDEYWTDNNLNNIGAVLTIIQLLVNEFDCIDTNRMYIGGLSGGADATWITLLFASDWFAAAFSMSGAPVSTDYANYYLKTPMWTFYSVDDNDQGVVRTNREMVAAIKNAGGDIVSTEYEEGGHIVTWAEGLQSPLFQWLFSHEKGNAQPNEDIDRLIEDYNYSIKPNLQLNYSLEKEINNDNCKTTESVLGDLVTDAMKEFTGADIALISSADLGAGIEKGDITESKILEALPVKLKTSVVELTGSDILTLLTNSLTYYPEADGRFLQMSGLQVNFDPNLRPSERIISTLVNGVPLDTQKKYKVAITDHLVSNKLNGTYVNSLEVKQQYYQTVDQMFVNYLNGIDYNTLNLVKDRINIIE